MSTGATTSVAQPVDIPLSAQIARPLVSLASAPDGEHVLTISVTPDALGPITVRAHISAGEVRIELFAPTDSARDGLKQIMTDLRRDMAGSGLSAIIDVSSAGRPDAVGTGTGGAGQGGAGAGGNGAGAGDAGGAGANSGNQPHTDLAGAFASSRPLPPAQARDATSVNHTIGSATTLDILA
jgi:flagellar hook-length control protein FliK